MLLISFRFGRIKKNYVIVSERVTISWKRNYKLFAPVPKLFIVNYSFSSVRVVFYKNLQAKKFFFGTR